MRAGPFSDDKIIKILNRYYVPFYASHEDYERGENGVPKEETAVFSKLMQVFHAAKFETGSVFVYIFTGDLTPLGTLHVAKASNTDVLEKFLMGYVSRIPISGGEVSFKPRPQSVPPPASKDSLILHVFIRGINMVRKFPHEDYIVVSPEEIQRLLPPARRTGESWALDQQVATRVGQRIHPTIEWLLSDEHGYTTRIDQLNIRATELPSTGEFKIARLEGKLKMLRTSFYFTPDKSHVSANLSGYMKYNGSRVVSLEISVQDAFFGDGSLNDKEFEGYVESMPGGGPGKLQERMTSSN